MPRNTDYTLSTQKYTDEELLAFMRKFFAENDQLPPHLTIAEHFNVAVNGVFDRLRRLERDGFFQRNDVNKIMFARGQA